MMVLANIFLNQILSFCLQVSDSGLYTEILPRGGGGANLGYGKKRGGGRN